MTARPQPSLFDKPVPYQRRSDTSKAAAVSMEPEKVRLRKAVLNEYIRAGDRGLTADECAARLKEPDMPDQENKLRIRPRVTELFNAELLEKTKERRTNDSGCTARVLRIRPQFRALALA